MTCRYHPPDRVGAYCGECDNCYTLQRLTRAFMDAIHRRSVEEERIRRHGYFDTAYMCSRDDAYLKADAEVDKARTALRRAQGFED